MARTLIYGLMIWECDNKAWNVEVLIRMKIMMELIYDILN